MSTTSEFAKEYNLFGKKASHPASEKQFEYALKLGRQTGSNISASKSRVTKSMESSDMSEAIGLMLKGEKVYIY